MENFLLEGEDILTTTPSKVVVLTTHRIRYNTASSQAHVVSIMLEKVSSCEIRYQSSPAVLLIGILMVILGGFGLTAIGNNGIFGLPLILGLIMIVAFLTTRRHIVKISSDGGSYIGFETKGLKKETVVSFVNSIEKAKHERLMSLCQIGHNVHA